MKKLFGMAIFLLLALPVFAEEPAIFLTNQSGTQTTQFESGDDIYIEGICLPANQDMFKIYITYDKIWQIGDNFSDVSASIETLTANADGKISRTKIWKSPLNRGEYDVAIDTNNNFTLQDYEQKCVIGIAGAGFRVGNPTPPPLPAIETPPSPPPPPPAPTPPPISTPPLSLKPSVVFSLDEHVKAGGLANIRKSPGGTLIGSQIKGALGVVVGGPVQASLGGNNYWFWNIDFENDPDGWIAASMLKSAPAPAPVSAEETVAKENVAEPATTTETTVTEETPAKETAADKMLAQVSSADKGSGLNQFMGSIIIGAALFFGLICSSFIITRAFRKK